jgi:hypothetical protein
MKIRWILAVGIFLAACGLPNVLAQKGPAPRAEVSALYDKADRSLEAKDLEAYMSMFTDDYLQIFAGADRQILRSAFRVRMGYDQLRASHTILSITQSGNMIKVTNNQKLEAKSGDKDWKVLSQNTVMDWLVQRDGGLKFYRSAGVDKMRLDRINGRTYEDEQTGLSFSVPTNWDIIPIADANMAGGVYVLAPDKTSVVLYGYVAPGITAKQAVEGDDAMGKLASNPEAYKLFKSGPITVHGREGFESESEFFIMLDRARHRRRVYFNAGDLLHVFCFDAMPPTKWDAVKDGFQSILDSVRVKER